jgi:hypothetical protein
LWPFRTPDAGADANWSVTTSLFLVLVLLPTVGLIFLKNRLGFLGPAVNVDLVLLYVGSVLIGRRSQFWAPIIATSGLTVILLVQIIMIVGLIYVDDPALIKEYLGFAKYWPWRLIGAWLLAGAAVVAATYLAIRKLPIGTARLSPAVAILVIITALDLLGRTTLGYETLKTNLATSSTVRAFKTLRSWSQSKGFVHSAYPGSSMATELAAQPRNPDRILSISVESFGLARDARFNQAILRPLETQLAGSYRVQIGAHTFKGATLSGEMRELCALRSVGTPTRADALSIRNGCAPAEMAAKGYSTLGIHGNSRFFYNRGEIYPAIGLQTMAAYEDLHAQGRRACRTRAFSGICDTETLQVAVDFLRPHPKAFVHVMTLDTHFPLGSRRPGDRECESGSLSLREPDGRCHGHDRPYRSPGAREA